MIELAGVSKIYESRKSAKFIVFGGVNYNFPSKGMFFITGKSGCGKTTLLNILGGLDKPSDGDIVVNGKKYSAFSEKEKNEYRTNTVGFVFQDYNLIGNMTVKDNLKTAAEI